jgi:plasmid stabilization system protein ParE
LLESIAEIERGEFFTSEQPLERLPLRLTSPHAIKISPRAADQIEAAAASWAENRPSAPGAIRSDVAQMLTILSAQPGIGAPARRTRIRGVRRASLPRVRYYLYYRVSGAVLEMLAFWRKEQSTSLVCLLSPA